jgi:hypothetical protein
MIKLIIKNINANGSEQKRANREMTDPRLLEQIEKEFASLPESDMKFSRLVKTEDEKQPHTALEISTKTKAGDNRIHKVIKLKSLYQNMDGNGNVHSRRYFAFIAPIFEYDTYSTFEDMINDIHNNWICKRVIISYKVVEYK